MFDLIVAFVGAVILSPAILLIAVIIKIESRGPVFYRGLRSGKNGRPFKIFKFRTMHSDRREHGPLTTSKNDPRITRVGEVLRRYKLDELPQLFDVIRGRMSLVGPRPEFPQSTDLYTDDEKEIIGVQPGITDFASIEFRYLADVVGDSDPDDAYFRLVWRKKMALRMFYVYHRSFSVDLVILLRTAKVMIRGK
jgi:lipopolysaccharide/colanic/teichoic acid biosynthesis glycosyltransferase